MVKSNVTDLIELRVSQVDEQIKESKVNFDKFKIKYFAKNPKLAKQLGDAYGNSLKVNPMLARDAFFLARYKLRIDLLGVAFSVLSEGLEDLQVNKFDEKATDWISRKCVEVERLLVSNRLLVDSFEQVQSRQKISLGYVFEGKLSSLRRKIIELEPRTTRAIIGVFKDTMVMSGVAPSGDEYSDGETFEED